MYPVEIMVVIGILALTPGGTCTITSYTTSQQNSAVQRILGLQELTLVCPPDSVEGPRGASLACPSWSKKREKMYRHLGRLVKRTPHLSFIWDDPVQQWHHGNVQEKVNPLRLLFKQVHPSWVFLTLLAGPSQYTQHKLHRWDHRQGRGPSC